MFSSMRCQVLVGFAFLLFVPPLLLIVGSLPVAAATIVYDIEAYVDDHDMLIMQGDALQWLHLGGGAAVGRLSGKNEPTIVSSALDGALQLDGVNWVPDWIARPPDEIRHDAYSSVIVGLTPALPAAEMAVNLDAIAARDHVGIAEFPNEANNYKLVLNFADHPGGAEWYHARLTITTPTPAAPAKPGA
jgi:hypothetical protein